MDKGYLTARNLDYAKLQHSSRKRKTLCQYSIACLGASAACLCRSPAVYLQQVLLGFIVLQSKLAVLRGCYVLGVGCGVGPIAGHRSSAAGSGLLLGVLHLSLQQPDLLVIPAGRLRSASLNPGLDACGGSHQQRGCQMCTALGPVSVYSKQLCSLQQSLVLTHRHCQSTTGNQGSDECW